MNGQATQIIGHVHFADKILHPSTPHDSAARQAQAIIGMLVEFPNLALLRMLSLGGFQQPETARATG